ncbi:MAG: thiamine phosphate synthase [Thermoguttaceae bacterium]
MRIDLSHAAFRVLQRAASPYIWQNIAFYRLISGGAGVSPLSLLDALVTEEDCRAAEWLAAEEITHDVVATRFGIPSPASPPSESASTEDNTAADEETKSPPTPQPVFPPQPTYAAPSATPSTIQFYVDGEQVHVGRVMPQVEAALTTVWQRCTRLNETLDTDIRNSQRGIIRVRRDVPKTFCVSAFAMATEHLLLAVALDDGDVGDWMREHANLEPNELFTRTERLYATSNDAHSPHAADEHKPCHDVIDFVDDDTLPSPFTASAKPESIARDVDEVSATTPTTLPFSVLRLLDAAANRAREAVRVLEDYARFVMNAADFTRRLKDVRHELATALQCLAYDERLAARETTNDVGTTIEADGEYHRVVPRDILAANAARLSESLRTLEEFLKLENPRAARAVEQLRYRCYTLEKEMQTGEVIEASPPSTLSTSNSPLASRLGSAEVYVITDAAESGDALRERVTELIAAGVDVIQLRDKEVSDRVLMERGEIVRELTSQSGTLFIVNDRIDIALALDADGVHLGQDELSPDAARRILSSSPRKVLIGVSTHSREQALTAMRDGADYIGIGPVFASSTKPQLTQFVDSETLRSIANGVTIPTFAIGGITPENVGEIWDCGITRVAVSSCIINAADKVAVVRALQKKQGE